MQSLDNYLLTNIWPVILVRHLLGTFRLQPTNTYHIGCGILPLGMNDFCMEMCTQYLAYIFYQDYQRLDGDSKVQKV